MYYKIIICHKQNESQIKKNQLLTFLSLCSYYYKIVSSIIHENMIAACNIHHVMIYIFQGWLSLILFWPILLLCQKLLETFFAFPFTYWEWDTEICKYLKAIKYSISMSLQHFKRIRNN